MSAPLSKSDIIFRQRLLRADGIYSDKIDGGWGKNTDQAQQEFDRRSVVIANELGRFDPRSEALISTLTLRCQPYARRVLHVLTLWNGRIISGTRSYLEQDALFAKGRQFKASEMRWIVTNPELIVTNARGGFSNHNFGNAFDIGMFDEDGRYLTGDVAYMAAYDLIRAETDLVEDGLGWGGLWTGDFKDYPHYDLKTGHGIAEVRRRFEAGISYFGESK